MTFLAIAVIALMSCKQEGVPVKPDPVEDNYKNSYSFIGTLEGPYVWEEGERMDVLSEDAGRKVGVAVMSGEAGSNKSTFIIKTDLEHGEKIVIRRGSSGLQTEQVQTIGAPSFAKYIYAETEPISLDANWATAFTLTPVSSFVNIIVKAKEGTEIYGKQIRSVTFEAEGIGSIRLTPTEPVTIAESQAVLPIVTIPSKIEGKTCKLVFDMGGTSNTVQFSGHDIAAGQTVTIEAVSLGGLMTPADRSKAEFTLTPVERKQTAEAASYVAQNLLLLDGMNWMPRYNACPLDRWGGYDGVKPDQITSSNPEGFWRTGKYKGRHVMVNPDGNVTIIHGVNGVCPDPEKEATSELSQKEYREHFSNTTEWVTYANRVLTDNSFNFYSSNPNRIRRTREFISEADQAVMRDYTSGKKLSEVALVYLLRTFSWDYNKETGKSFDAAKGSVFTLMFDPGYLDYIDALAKDAADLYGNDEGFIGYYLDNELQFRFSSASTQAIYLKQWLALDTSSSSPRAFQYAKAYAEKFMREKYGVEPKAANVTTAMDNAFLLDICDYYYRTTTEAMRKYDSNHLILGSRLHGKPKTLQQVHEACAKYCDVVSVNVYGVFEPNDDYFLSNYKSWIKGYDKPCFVTEFYTRDATAKYEGVLYGNTGEGGGWIVKGQTARGQHYQNFTRKLISYNHCIGWQWFQFTDDYRGADGWNNKGLITPKYDRYDECLNLMSRLHWNIYQIMEYYHNPSGVKTSPSEKTETVIWR